MLPGLFGLFSSSGYPVQPNKLDKPNKPDRQERPDKLKLQSGLSLPLIVVQMYCRDSNALKWRPGISDADLGRNRLGCGLQENIIDIGSVEHFFLQ